MKYEINIPTFEGPLDLLLHLIKEANIDIMDISIDEITKQYLDYINAMESLNLNIASEYLVMAAELIEIKAKSLLPKNNDETEEEDLKQNLIERLLDYQKSKEIIETFKELEQERNQIFCKEANLLEEFKEDETNIDYGVDLNDLIAAFKRVLDSQEEHKPLNTKIANKDFSISQRCTEIRDILRKKKEVRFIDLFDNFSKDYIIVTFLAILNLSKKGEIQLNQTKNFEDINILSKGNKL